MNDQLIENMVTYFKTRPEVVAVYLFGSYSSGFEKPTSDIDLGLLLNIKNTQSITIYLDRYLVELPRILRKNIHPIVLNTAGELLLKQIFSKGKCIFVRDRKELDRFRMIKYSQILDYTYLLNEMRSGFVRHLMQDTDDDR